MFQPETRSAVLKKLLDAGYTDETAQEALDGLKDQSGSVDEIIERILNHGAPEGMRNDELFEAACQLRDAGYAKIDVDAMVIPRAEADGLSPAEMAATLESVFNRAPRQALHGWNGQEPPTSSSPTAKSQPITLPPPIADGLKVLLETCFEEDECITVSDTKINASGEPKPGPGNCFKRETWLDRLKREPISEIYSTAKDGLLIRINPVSPPGKADKDVTDFRHVLAEFDLDAQGNRIPKEVQYEAIVKSDFPTAVVLDSGNKSLHNWIIVNAPDRAEYDRRREIIWEYFQKAGFPLDPRNKNPSRYSRCPGVDRSLR